MRDESLPATDTSAVSDSGPENGRLENSSLDEIHRLLSEERRRCLVSHLASRADASAATDELVDAVVERESPRPGPANHRTRVEIDLTHVHLPRLADAGVVEYDPVAGTVQYTPSKTLEALLAVSALSEEGHD